MDLKIDPGVGFEPTRDFSTCLQGKRNQPLCEPGICGEDGIRTHGAFSAPIRFPSVRHRPLGHLSFGFQYVKDLYKEKGLLVLN